MALIVSNPLLLLFNFLFLRCVCLSFPVSQWGWRDRGDDQAYKTMVCLTSCSSSIIMSLLFRVVYGIIV